jgi:iron complex transport system ATP-binding protein
MIEIRSIGVRYGQRRALEDVSLSVYQGEVVALIGPNGAGKSTLLRASSGLLPISSGSVLVDGIDIRQMRSNERAGRLAVVPQARNLPPAFTVYEAVLLGRTAYVGWLGKASEADHHNAEVALAKTQLLSLADRRVGELSGGEQQRVLLARALAQDSPTLLLDEPTTHLDLQHQSSLLNLTRTLANEHGKAILIALHDLNLAGIYADRVALLVGGRLRHYGSPGDVLTERNLAAVYNTPVHVIPHPQYGSPLILPDGLDPLSLPSANRPGTAEIVGVR